MALPSLKFAHITQELLLRYLRIPVLIKLFQKVFNLLTIATLKQGDQLALLEVAIVIDIIVAEGVNQRIL